MKIAFHSNQLSERGCELALFDYCRFSKRLLGHQPVVFYGRHAPGNVDQVIHRFASEFELVDYQDFAEVDRQIEAQSIDLFYAIKGGEIDGIYSRRVPSMIHAVFAQSPFEVHGSSYAFISEWLAWKCSASFLPAVPFMVHPAAEPDPVSVRLKLGIPLSATVFAGYGGAASFDLDFVRQAVIPEILRRRPDAHFLFMNFAQFMDHPRVHFLPRSTDQRFKENFVAASDAMLHARRQGESFGMACAEFSAQAKPIFAYRYTPDRHPQFILRDAIRLYSNSGDLIDQLLAFDRCEQSSPRVSAYLEHYSPDAVMDLFDRHLIYPAVRAGAMGVNLTVMTQPWRRPLSPMLRGFFWYAQILLRRCQRLQRLVIRWNSGG